MFNRPHDRRRYGRVSLTPPAQGLIDTTRVSLIEVSVVGTRVLHEGRIAGAGSHRLRFEWDQQQIEYSCELVRTTVSRLARKPGETTMYVTGVRLTTPHGGSDEALRAIIAEHVVRAINEQLANAHGIAPLAVATYQTDKSDRFRRCEYTNGGWRRIDTPKPDQPDDGFTVSGDVEPYSVDILCRTYEALDAKGRELTRLFAQLSTDGKEGAPVRHYLP